MATCIVFAKDPDAELDYSVDWTAFLDNEIIVASTWSVPTGIVKITESFTTTGTVIWLSGGSLGQTYSLVNSITTDSTPPRKDDRTITIRIEQK